MRNRFLIVLALAGFAVGGLVLSGATAMAGKTKSKVTLKIRGPNAKGEYTYKVKVKPKDCRKGARVVIWHDEEPYNGKLDDGEFVIAEGVTNSRGKFKAKSMALPPEGDDAVAQVRGVKGCKKGKDAVTIDDDD